MGEGRPSNPNITTVHPHDTHSLPKKDCRGSSEREQKFVGTGPTNGSTTRSMEHYKKCALHNTHWHYLPRASLEPLVNIFLTRQVGGTHGKKAWRRCPSGSFF